MFALPNSFRISYSNRITRGKWVYEENESEMKHQIKRVRERMIEQVQTHGLNRLESEHTVLWVYTHRCVAHWNTLYFHVILVYACRCTQHCYTKRELCLRKKTNLSLGNRIIKENSINSQAAANMNACIKESGSERDTDRISSFQRVWCVSTQFKVFAGACPLNKQTKIRIKNNFSTGLFELILAWATVMALI